MATKITVLLETDPTPDLASQVRQALKHLGPCEVFMVADTADEEVGDAIAEAEAEDLDTLDDAPETCPACGQALAELEHDEDPELEDQQEEEEGSLDE